MDEMSEPFVREQDLAIRRMRDDPSDYGLMVRWRNAPHVREWWDPDEPLLTIETVRQAYRPKTEPSPLTTACIVELAGRPVGYVQFYRWSSWAKDARQMNVDFDEDTFGLDIFIGEPELVGTGIGSRTMDLACRYLFSERGASAVSLTTEVANLRAQRAYEKAGFKKIRRILELDTRNGERVTAWLMTRTREFDPAAEKPS
jgi:aminoglycoside 6'-N-acetyltransferase